MSAAAAQDQDSKSGEVTVNGLKIHYAIRGTGMPLILLHGGVAASEVFDPHLPALSEKRKVITVDLQAHGRTSDIDRPLRCELMADDIAALIVHLGIEQADVMGYSLGGGVALQVAIRHPKLLRKLVIISTTFKRDGWYPECLASMDQLGPALGESMKQTPLYKLYPSVNWSKLFTKLGDLLRQDYDWSQDVAAINVPTLLVFADADAIRMTHILEFFALLGGGQKDGGLDGSGRPTAQLAILPGFTHYDLLSSPALVSVVNPFLDASISELGEPKDRKIK
ncbi:MAG: alpha/beta hydrolase [Planctomycetaceae bacterium]|nr:alpha/beta hydrolase [Planctomycetaceae bacterium]